MPARKADSVATAYLCLLAERGVEYLFGNAGTDFAPIIEAYAEAEQKGTRVPQPILATHENLAVTMAHGYAMVSRKIPAVMVHVSVGTANMVCAAMNAARENIAILLTAGRSPITEARPARLARRLYPLGAGNVRPGRHDSGIGQMGLRAAQRRAARNRRRSRPLHCRYRAARACLPKPPARGSSGASTGRTIGHRAVFVPRRRPRPTAKPSPRQRK